MEGTTRLEVRTGWTTFDAASDDAPVDAIVERALERGTQERERYAFFSSLGHELRTPLSSIRGYLETLLDDRVDEETRRRFVRIAHGESLRLSRLVDGMFEISLLDLTERMPLRATGSLAEALRAAVDACAAAANERRIGVATDEPEGVSVALDEDRLTLVLVNLIGNAVKHGRPGGAVFVSVDVSDERAVRVSVDDDGPGVAADECERVFAFGERGVTDAEGSGIGLALVRLIVERAGGRVQLERSPLGGARFVVTVPRP
jgi:signal transduction histidine kinase